MLQARQLLSLLDSKLSGLASSLTPGQRSVARATAVLSPLAALGLSIPPAVHTQRDILPEWTRQTRERDPLRRIRNMFIRPPKGVVKVNGLVDLMSYSSGIPNKYVRDAVVRAAIPIVSGKQPNAFFIPPMGGARKGAVIVNNSVAPAVLKHEMGHAKDFQTASFPGKAYRFSALGRLLNAPIAAVVGNSLSPTGAAERRAWKLSGVPKDNPLREKALDTYNTSTNIPANTLRAGALGAMILKYVK